MIWKYSFEIWKEKRSVFFFIIEALKISYSTLSKSIQIQEEFTGVPK